MNMAWGTIKNYEPPVKATDINIEQFEADIDHSMTIIQDDDQLLHISSPCFRASATVEIPKLPPGANIQIGWIQVCTEMTLVCVYGDVGIVSSEIPELVTGKYDMISDACGEKFPWYGPTTQVTDVQGPTSDKIVRTVFMDDSLHINPNWTVPNRQFNPPPNLTFVYRKQKFFTYLALKDVKKGVFQVLETLEWSIEMAIDVDTNKPVGKRSTLLGPRYQQCPRSVRKHQTNRIKCYALSAPTCNTAQVVLWRPYHGDVEVIFPPMSTKFNLKTYAIESDEYAKNLLIYTKENFLSAKI